jgi:hypothetical protein
MIPFSAPVLDIASSTASFCESLQMISICERGMQKDGFDLPESISYME